MREPQPKTIYLKDYTPPAFRVETVELDVDIRDDHALVRARLLGRRSGGTPLGALPRPVPEALLPLRDGGGEPRAHRRLDRHALGKEKAALRLRRAGQARPGRLGDGLLEARHRLGRDALRP